MNTVHELYNLSLKEAKEDIICDIMKQHNVTAREAEELFKNSLIYNVVNEAILEQVNYLVNGFSY